MSPTIFRQINRGSKGSSVMGVKEDDVVEHMFLATTHSYLLAFTSIGKVHWIKGYQIPEGGRQASGRAIVNLLQLEEDEIVTALLPIKKFDDLRRLFMITKKGVAKMVMLSAFSRPLSRGIIAIKLKDDDKLVGVKPILGGEQVVIATRKGYAIRFCENEVRVMGRTARGVKAITFREKDDEVVGMEVFRTAEDKEKLMALLAEEEEELAQEQDTSQALQQEKTEDAEIVEEFLVEEDAADKVETPEDQAGKEIADKVVYEGKLLTVSELGFGKQTNIKNYRVTHRGGKGVINLKIMKKTGEVLAIKRMFEGDELMVVTTTGKVVRLSADKIRNTGRAASGVKLITLGEDDKLISVVRIPAKEEAAD
jgi:DNA gyrase subunit A